MFSGQVSIREDAFGVYKNAIFVNVVCCNEGARLQVQQCNFF